MTYNKPHLMVGRQNGFRPVVRIQKDILKFQIAVDDLFAVDVVHLGATSES